MLKELKTVETNQLCCSSIIQWFNNGSTKDMKITGYHFSALTQNLKLTHTFKA